MGVRSSNRVIESALVRRPTFHRHSTSRVVDAIIRDAFSSLRAEQVAPDARKNSPILTWFRNFGRLRAPMFRNCRVTSSKAARVVAYDTMTAGQRQELRIPRAAIEVTRMQKDDRRTAATRLIVQSAAIGSHVAGVDSRLAAARRRTRNSTGWAGSPGGGSHERD